MISSVIKYLQYFELCYYLRCFKPSEVVQLKCIRLVMVVRFSPDLYFNHLPASLPLFQPAFLPLFLPGCLPSCLPSCLPAYLPPCLPVCLPELPTFLPACRLPASIPACLHTFLPACQSTCLPWWVFEDNCPSTGRSCWGQLRASYSVQYVQYELYTA